MTAKARRLHQDFEGLMKIGTDFLGNGWQLEAQELYFYP